MLIRRFQDLERDEGEAFGPELVERGARERLAPILTTAVGARRWWRCRSWSWATSPGLEVVHPMAIVMLGGLVTTTFLSLFVLPALYLRFGAGASPALAPEEELMHRWAGVEPEAAAGARAVRTADGDPLPARTRSRRPRRRRRR